MSGNSGNTVRWEGIKSEHVMEQKHTEQTIDHTDGDQDTGNHKKPGAPDAGGADKFGGTRAGAENVDGKLTKEN